MPDGVIFGRLDVAELCWYLFLIFFAGLIIYLRREDRREGYPLEADTTGRREPPGSFLLFADPKKFILPHGQGTVVAPENKRETRPLAMRRLAPWPGAPSEPTGDPLVDGVGPAAYAERAKRPDLGFHGEAKIVPMRAAEGLMIVPGQAKLIGYFVYGSDGRMAGVVSDIWVDRPENLIRYLEVTLKPTPDAADGRRVLMPMFVASVNKAKKAVTTDSIVAEQFANIPALEGTDRITLYEEERVQAYFGGGYLYSTPLRKEPLV